MDFMNDPRLNHPGAIKEVVAALESQIEELNQEIEKYKNYKIYYEMSYQLQHGKKD